MQLEGLLRPKNIGNVTLWTLIPGQESYNFPADYFKVSSQYLEFLVKGTEDQIYSLMQNCLNSGAVIDQLLVEIILPAIDHVNNLYNDGKIGISELNLLKTIISKSIHIFNQIPVTLDTKKNVIVIAAEPDKLIVF